MDATLFITYLILQHIYLNKIYVTFDLVVSVNEINLYYDIREHIEYILEMIFWITTPY